MRLVVKETPDAHTAVVTGLAWAKTEKQFELFTCADDQTVKRWDHDGERAVTKVDCPSYCTALDILPASADGLVAVSFSDGSFALYTKAGREDKRIPNAHRGGITTIKWNYEGSAIVTGGEDGLCKVWSKSGMLRSSVAQQAHPIYAVAWSQDSESLVFCCEKSLTCISVQAGQKQTSWKAHDGIVLCCDWSASSGGLIVSGGEDCRYKVWDSYGRLLFNSQQHEHVITSVAWAPDGKTFAVGAFNLLKLCDRSGWSHVRETTNTGSIFSIRWSLDGTGFAGAGGNGSLVFGNLVDRSMSWQSLDVALDSSLNTLVVRDLLHETIEELDFRDRVIEFSVAHDHLVVVTNYQVFIYAITKGILNTTPQVEDLKEAPTLILQSVGVFALADSQGLHVLSYEARSLQRLRYQGMRVEFFTEKTVSLTSDMVAVVEKNSVRLFDLHTGKQVMSVDHKQEITHVALSQHSGEGKRFVAILDKNKDLYLFPAHKPHLEKLGSMVDDFLWNDATDMLVALVDQTLSCFLYPSVVFVDNTLLPLTVATKPCDAGNFAQLVSFHGPHVLIRKADGSNVAAMLSPYPLLLYHHIERGRFVKQSECWACLACQGIQARELNTVEIALAAINEIDKVQYVAYINNLPDEVLKTAELALFCKKPDEALSTLLSHRRIFRAIKMCIRLHRWEQALDLAVQNKTHVDTVLAYRARHLKQMRHVEGSEKFKQYAAEVPHDWETVQAKIAMEKERERN
ncbi:unnamed protein product [Amoebophrya sp. A25]|nr:unnamed protein product [Amoebophrya sp. A25]|eukprot:GSA25T00016788001.1